MKLFNIFCPMDSEFNSVVKTISHLIHKSKKVLGWSIVDKGNSNSHSFMFVRKNTRQYVAVVVTKTGMGSFNITNALWQRQLTIHHITNNCDPEHVIKDIQFLLAGYCGAVDPDYKSCELLRVAQVQNLTDHFIHFGMLKQGETIDSFWSNPYLKEKDMLDTYKKRPGLKEAVAMEVPFLVNSKDHKRTLSRYADIVDQESYSFIQTIESLKKTNLFESCGKTMKIEEPQIIRFVSDAVNEPFDYGKQDEYSKNLRHQLYKFFPDFLQI